jgi:cysteinyl-tRNA synthetase
MMLLSTHYRSPLLFEPELLDEATSKLDRVYTALEILAGAEPTAPDEAARLASVDTPFTATAQGLREKFDVALDDDFNTAGALGALFELVSAANKELLDGSVIKADQTLRPAQVQALATARSLLRRLGLRAHREVHGGGGGADELVDLLMRCRKDARAAKQYALGDAIRDGLSQLGYVVKDLPGGAWDVKRA